LADDIWRVKDVKKHVTGDSLNGPRHSNLRPFQRVGLSYRYRQAVHSDDAVCSPRLPPQSLAIRGAMDGTASNRKPAFSIVSDEHVIRTTLLAPRFTLQLIWLIRRAGVAGSPRLGSMA